MLRGKSDGQRYGEEDWDGCLCRAEDRFAGVVPVRAILDVHPDCPKAGHRLRTREEGEGDE